MDIVGILTSLGGILGGLSIWEAIKYVINRKTNKRKEEAEADQSEFAVLREIAVFMQEQLKGEVERYADQTKRLRKTQDENFRLLREIETLKLAMVKAGADIDNVLKEDSNMED